MDADTARAHKFRIIVYGFLKFLGVFFYGMLIHWTAQAKVVLGFLLVIFLLVGLICAPIHGGMLIYAGFKEDRRAMYRGTLACLAIGGYDVFVGIFGFCVFMTSLMFTLHLILMILYLALAFNIIRVFYYDYFLFSAYTKILGGAATTLINERKFILKKIKNINATSVDEEEEEEEEEEN